MTQHASNRMMFVFDFDGVICDGLDECLLTAWITAHDVNKDKWESVRIGDIPLEFRQRFSALRNFVRHDGHFLVPFIIDASSLSATDFDAIFDRVSPLKQQDFRDRFHAVRSYIRTNRRKDWLAMHRIYEPMINVLKRLDKFFIVSGKDDESIREIMATQGIILNQEQIIGRQTDKTTTLRSLAEKAQREARSLIFCDDNLANVVAATAIGIEAIWALWGYHTTTDLEHAACAQVRAAHLDEVDTLFIS